MRYRILLLLAVLSACANVQAAKICGRVVDKNGSPLVYATVYPVTNPVEGTATNDQGLFCLETESDTALLVAVTYVGYKQKLLTTPVPSSPVEGELLTVVLEEQPIALEEMVIEAKRTRMSKRKMLARILRETYLKLKEDLPRENVRYTLVSDVKMDASEAPWGMEQMGVEIIEAPGKAAEGKDSLQFWGQWCKRYCSPEVRVKIDSVLKHDSDRDRQRMANGLDKGTLTHRALWSLRMDPDHLLDTSDELRRWKMSAEDDARCVLTYTRKYNYLGILKATLTENLIVDAYDYRLQSYTVDLTVKLNLPFAMKIEGVYLEWLNLLSNGGESAEKFRLKKANMHARVSNVYKERNGVLVPVEKNLEAEGEIVGKKGIVLPVKVWATQHVGEVKTGGVVLREGYNKHAEVPRTLVPIY